MPVYLKVFSMCLHQMLGCVNRGIYVNPHGDWHSASILQMDMQLKHNNAQGTFTIYSKPPKCITMVPLNLLT